jgi:predicted nucleic acid-binding protein
MGQGYLIDSNVVIDLLNGKLTDKAKIFLYDVKSIISFVTYIEIFSSNKISLDERQKIEMFVEASKILLIDDDIIEQSIIIRLNTKVKLPDAIIAATAITNNLTLLTRNISDFVKINDLKFINPHSL